MNPPPQDTDRGILRLWSWLLPLLFGLTVGRFGMACLEVWLSGFNGRSHHVAIASDLTVSSQEVDSDSIAAFLRTNPFRVTPMPVSNSSELKTDDAPLPNINSMGMAVLKGTSPGYLAWLEDKGKLRLIMLGSRFDAYTLEEVTYMEAVFVKDDERVVKEISYGKEGPPSTRVEHLQSTMPTNAAPQVAYGQSNVDTDNSFTFEQLRKITFLPFGAGQGLRVDWVDQDGVFGLAGVRAGDEIRRINETDINKIMDVTNALDSFVGATYLYIEVVRDGETIMVENHVR